MIIFSKFYKLVVSLVLLAKEQISNLSYEILVVI